MGKRFPQSRELGGPAPSGRQSPRPATVFPGLFLVTGAGWQLEELGWSVLMSSSAYFDVALSSPIRWLLENHSLGERSLPPQVAARATQLPGWNGHGKELDAPRRAT